MRRKFFLYFSVHLRDETVRQRSLYEEKVLGISRKAERWFRSNELQPGDKIIICVFPRRGREVMRSSFHCSCVCSGEMYEVVDLQNRPPSLEGWRWFVPIDRVEILDNMLMDELVDQLRSCGLPEEQLVKARGAREGQLFLLPKPLKKRTRVDREVQPSHHAKRPEQRTYPCFVEDLDEYDRIKKTGIIPLCQGDKELLSHVRSEEVILLCVIEPHSLEMGMKNLTKANLAKLLKSQGKPYSGTKEELMERASEIPRHDLYRFFRDYLEALSLFNIIARCTVSPKLLKGKTDGTVDLYTRRFQDLNYPILLDQLCKMFYLPDIEAQMNFHRSRCYGEELSITKPVRRMAEVPGEVDLAIKNAALFSEVGRLMGEIGTNRPFLSDFIWDFRTSSFVHYNKYLRSVVLERPDCLRAVFREDSKHGRTLVRGMESILDEVTRDNIDDLDGPGFERFMRKLVERMGFHVERTAPTYDGGVDIYAYPKPRVHPEIFDGTYIFQCKRWKADVGPDPVKAFESTIRERGALKGVFVTTSRFTRSALKFAESCGHLMLVDREKLLRLMDRWCKELDTV